MKSPFGTPKVLVCRRFFPRGMRVSHRSAARWLASCEEEYGMVAWWQRHAFSDAAKDVRVRGDPSKPCGFAFGQPW
ncbi:hypothetical protein AM571_CH01936 [Rhizobium etli 8C-3]|uniref:Uncharacterized protein n=1 Tax=Rhizobium etli 8C-3 TaxID=538025 RepID=A0A1L5P3L2_RHIET|nr:hypothetical protein AM571_CH01936 [Rhizobium etli 8C-3]